MTPNYQRFKSNCFRDSPLLSSESIARKSSPFLESIGVNVTIYNYKYTSTNRLILNKQYCLEKTEISRHIFEVVHGIGKSH
jgi:hypothetical protein